MARRVVSMLVRVQAEHVGYTILHFPNKGQRVGNAVVRLVWDNWTVRSRTLRLNGQNLPDVSLRNADEIAIFLTITINQIRRGELPVNVGNCLGILSQTLMTAQDKSDVAKRLERIENELNLNEAEGSSLNEQHRELIGY